jgi:hypothetical protein
MWVDRTVTSSSTDPTYYHSIKDRPNTVKEQFDLIYTYVDTQIVQAKSDITSTTAGLTTDQKNAIGANIFDSGQSSSSTSLDGKSENNRLNLIQLARDLYGGGYTLDNDGAANLLNNSVFAMVDALLELHNGNWDDDVVLDHTGAFTANQTDINPSAVYDDNFVGAPADTQDDFNQIRTEMKEMRGTTTWTTALSALYGGGANSLEDLLATTSGTATKSASNPWGYHYDDIDGLATALDALRDYTGQDDHTDSTPDYTSTIYISNGDSLEVALGKLDAALVTVSGGGGGSFIAQADTPVSYSGAARAVLFVNTAEDAIDFTSSPVLASVTTGDAGAGEVTVTINSGVQSDGDVQITQSGYGLVLFSPNGSAWRVRVDDSGALFTTELT